eukprot:5469982-Lingulodinium_polyedra.AAC.1
MPLPYCARSAPMGHGAVRPRRAWRAGRDAALGLSRPVGGSPRRQHGGWRCSGDACKTMHVLVVRL